MGVVSIFAFRRIIHDFEGEGKKISDFQFRFLEKTNLTERSSKTRLLEQFWDIARAKLTCMMSYAARRRIVSDMDILLQKLK